MIGSVTCGYAASPGTCWKKADEDVVLLNLAQAKYLVLSGVGARMWELLSNQSSLEKICSVILDEFETTEPVVTEDLKSFLSELRSEGWIVAEQ
jgi:hypothetical protein